MVNITLKKITPKFTVFDFDDLHMETGIIENKSHYQPKANRTRKLGTLTVRGKSNKLSKRDTLAICEKIDNQFGILSKPKQLHSTKFIDTIMQSLIGDWLFNDKHKNVALNGWRSFFRQPMLQGEYKNKSSTATVKGFNRGGIDTGQLYESIESVIVKDNKIWSLNK